MQPALERFIKALRAAEVPVSVREAIEAHNVVAAVGYDSRRVLKEALAVTLAKTVEEKVTFDTCFEMFFAREEMMEPLALGDGGGRDHDESDAALPLANMLLQADAAGLAAAMEGAANDIGATEIRFFTQRGYFTRQILDAMGLRDLERMIAQLRQQGDAGAQSQAGALERGRGFLLDEARAFVERQHDLYAAPRSERLREEFLERAKLNNIEIRDFARMQRLVRKMAKRLADKHTRRRKQTRRGQLDIRRTIRNNVATDGVPFELVWKYRKRDRPRVVAICDVSRSVSAAARFLLMFLYSLTELIDEIHAFAFSDHLHDVSPILEQQTIEDAIAQILRDIGYRPTNYGQMLVEFKQDYLRTIDRRTTVIVMGDGRGNFTDPQAPVLREISQRAKRLIWLNPEPKTFWGTGDSDMPRYVPSCQLARNCSTVKHLERTIDDMLRAYDN